MSLYQIPRRPSAANEGLTRAESGTFLIYRGVGKRIFDILFVIALAPLLVLIVAVLSVIIKSDGGPAFYGHWRVGRSGKEFRCWKLRSMTVNAAQELEKHLAENPSAKVEWEENFKLVNDPRVTRVGRFIRKTRLDELPQFWNVLVGDMSIVGPRPVTSQELELFGDAASSILSVRPGITGPWQVTGCSDTSYAERVQMDKAYTTKICLKTDMALVARTVVVMLQMTGR